MCFENNFFLVSLAICEHLKINQPWKRFFFSVYLIPYTNQSFDQYVGFNDKKKQKLNLSPEEDIIQNVETSS